MSPLGQNRITTLGRGVVGQTQAGQQQHLTRERLILASAADRHARIRFAFMAKLPLTQIAGHTLDAQLVQKNYCAKGDHFFPNKNGSPLPGDN